MLWAPTGRTRQNTKDDRTTVSHGLNFAIAAADKLDLSLTEARLERE